VRVRTRMSACAGAAVLVAAPLIAAAGPSASADSTSIDFETFAVGSPNGQAGWTALGSAGLGGTPYDHQVVANAGAPSSFGTRSLRISNAVTSGAFGDQTYSSSLGEAAGEVDADNGLLSLAATAYSSPASQSHFEAQWDFTSAAPDAEQVGLAVVASPDRGDGARMGWVQMVDTPEGLGVNVSGYRDEHPVGSAADLGLGCGNEDNWFTTTVAAGLARGEVHTIKVSTDFLPGARNDVVRIWVDGTLRHVDTSWEDYYRFCTESSPPVGLSRTVDSILFRTAGTAAPGTAGKGFLIDNLTLLSSNPAPSDATGTWEAVPGQSTVTTDTVTTTAYRALPKTPVVYQDSGSYKSAASGTKNDGSKGSGKGSGKGDGKKGSGRDDGKKDDAGTKLNPGVVALAFDLESSTRTVVTETTSTGGMVFESTGPDAPDVPYSFLSFTPDAPMRFADLDSLVADYDFITGDCGGGSLRWSVTVDVGSDGDPSNDKPMYVYFGDSPNFTDCNAPTTSNSGDNLIGSSDARFDLQNLGGPFYGTYADALNLIGTLNVVRASLVVDGYWFGGPQVVTLTGAEVDGATWVPEPEGTSQTVISDTTSDYAPTCDLPPARITWEKIASGGGPHGEQSDGKAPKADTGPYYRIADCSYVYNLDARRLDGNDKTRPGTYAAWVNIDGTKVDTASVFDIRNRSSGTGGH